MKEIISNNIPDNSWSSDFSLAALYENNLGWHWPAKETQKDMALVLQKCTCYG